MFVSVHFGDAPGSTITTTNPFNRKEDTGTPAPNP